MPTRLHLDFDVPDGLGDKDKAAVEQSLRQEAVIGLFKRNLCSGGFAAKLLGLRLAEFLELLKEYGVPYSRPSRAAMSADRRGIARWKSERKRRSASP